MKKKILFASILSLMLVSVSCKKENKNETITSEKTSIITSDDVSTSTSTNTSTSTSKESSTTSSKKDIDGITLNDKEVTYDGLAKVIKIEGTLPQGVNVSYTYTLNNVEVTRCVDAGTYNVNALLHDDNGIYNDLSLNANLIIKKANFDISIIPATYTYDGLSHEPTINGLNDSISVSKIIKDENNNTVSDAIDAGVYNFTYTFKKDNYNDLTLESSITINKADFNVTVDDLEVDYDGQSHLIIPTGNFTTNDYTYTIVDENNTSYQTAVDAGIYYFNFEFRNDNYNPLNITKTLYISGDPALKDVTLPDVVGNYNVGGGYPINCKLENFSSLQTSGYSYTFNLENYLDYPGLYDVECKIYNPQGRLVKILNAKRSIYYYYNRQAEAYYVGLSGYERGLVWRFDIYTNTDEEETILSRGLGSFKNNVSNVIIPGNIIQFNLWEESTNTFITENDRYNFTYLAAETFKNSTAKTVYIPDTIESLGESCFEGASKLKVLILPKSIKEIGANCFKDTTTKLLYPGTKEEFISNVDNNDTNVDPDNIYYLNEASDATGKYYKIEFINYYYHVCVYEDDTLLDSNSLILRTM